MRFAVLRVGSHRVAQFDLRGLEVALLQCRAGVRHVVGMRGERPCPDPGADDDPTESAVAHAFHPCSFNSAVSGGAAPSRGPPSATFSASETSPWASIRPYSVGRLTPSSLAASDRVLLLRASAALMTSCSARSRAVRRSRSGAPSSVRRQFQVGGVDHAPVRHHDGTLQPVFQLAHIARPVMRRHRHAGLLGEARASARPNS